VLLLLLLLRVQSLEDRCGWSASEETSAESCRK
jgi:hypothetical protein